MIRIAILILLLGVPAYTQIPCSYRVEFAIATKTQASRNTLKNVLHRKMYEDGDDYTDLGTQTTGYIELINPNLTVFSSNAWIVDGWRDISKKNGWRLEGLIDNLTNYSRLNIYAFDINYFHDGVIDQYQYGMVNPHPN